MSKAILICTTRNRIMQETLVKRLMYSENDGMYHNLSLIKILEYRGLNGNQSDVICEIPYEN